MSLLSSKHVPLYNSWRLPLSPSPTRNADQNETSRLLGLYDSSIRQEELHYYLKQESERGRDFSRRLVPYPLYREDICVPSG